ncbi:hypothetical protein Tco_1214596 [Tanacetum coccineum]
MISTNDVQDEYNGVSLDGSEDIGSKPPGFESFIEKDANPFLNSKEVEEKRGNINTINAKKVEEKSGESNVSIPPGFENFVAVKGASSSSSRSRSAKCSTSFGNFKSKDRKGFSFIDEMNMMIEVGGALGYNVKGCKRSLRKMINGICVENGIPHTQLLNELPPTEEQIKKVRKEILNVSLREQIKAVLISSRASILVNGSLNITLKDGLAANMFRGVKPFSSIGEGSELPFKDHFTNGTWSWDWCRPVNGGRTYVDLNNLLTNIRSLIISDGRDRVVSSLSTDGIYLVSDLRKHIDVCLLLNSLPRTSKATMFYTIDCESLLDNAPCSRSLPQFVARPPQYTRILTSFHGLVIPLSHLHWKSTMAGGLHQYLVGFTLVDSLNINADVLEMAKYVKDYKIILVYVEHRSSNVDTSIFVTPKKGVAIAVDNHLRKAPIEIDSSPDVNRNLTPMCHRILKKEWEHVSSKSLSIGEYAHIEKQITRNKITRNESTGNEIIGKQMAVYVGNSSTVDDVLELELLFRTERVGLVGKFKEVEVDAEPNKVIAKTVGLLTPSVTKMFNAIKRKATEYNVQWNGGFLYQVTEPYKDQYVVNMDRRVCFCRKWELTRIPYKHDVAAIYNMSKNLVGAV